METTDVSYNKALHRTSRWMRRYGLWVIWKIY
jgi:hypothetical protein